MKIRELIKENIVNDVSSFNSKDQLLRYLKTNRYTKIGYGKYSDVYAKSSDHVIKVSREKDTCWETFVNYCKTHSNNPHLLKVFFYKKFSDGEAFCVSERLRYAKGNELDRPGLFSFIWQHKLSSDYRGIMRMINRWMNKPSEEKANAFYEKNKLLCNTLLEMKNLCGSTDMHGENVMIRPSTLEMVLFDPVTPTTLNF